MITISKVLRDHPDIGDETRERVLARVKELDQALDRYCLQKDCSHLWTGDQS